MKRREFLAAATLVPLASALQAAPTPPAPAGLSLLRFPLGWTQGDEEEWAL